MTDIARLYPAYRYRDPAAMIDWLTGTIGFREEARHEADGVIHHAELSFGASILMLGTVRDDAHNARVGAPDAGGGADGGKTLYVAVPDPDALFARVKASGVEVVETPTDRDYGSREFQCRDPEGNLWSFGTYAPVPGG